MTAQQIKDQIRDGKLIQCTSEEYSFEVRTMIQTAAAAFIDEGQDIRAAIAFEEIKRLDIKFNYSGLFR